jgi:cell division septal protein FtsQ
MVESMCQARSSHTNVDRDSFNIDNDGNGPFKVVPDPNEGYVLIRFSGYSAEFLLSTINMQNGKYEALFTRCIRQAVHF